MMWAAAVLSIVVVSWAFYRTFPPAAGKDWSRAGVVQAFIIAFYAEMYGFPVTLYALTRVLRLDVSGTFWDGNLWVYVTGTPASIMIAMMIGYSLVFLGIKLVTAGWREVYRARTENRMATEGPYSAVRHPQYTGFFLVVFGESVAHWPTVLSLAAFPIVVAAYAVLARQEEREMLRRFGHHYVIYRRGVGMFLPRAGHWRALYDVIATGVSRAPGQ